MKETRISLLHSYRYWSKVEATGTHSKKKNIEKRVQPNNVEIAYGINIFFKEGVVCQHYIPFLVQFKNEKQLHNLNFVYDQVPSHINQRVKRNLVKVKYVSL